MINLKRTKEIKKFDFIYIFDLKLSFYDFLENGFTPFCNFKYYQFRF